MRRTLKASIALVLCLAAAGAALAASNFTDPAGDSGVAPDITAVTAANDASGNLTFTVRTNLASLTADDLIDVWFDSDNNGATGDEGDDYVFSLFSTGWELAKWNGTTYAQASASSANASYSAGVATFKVNKADLGIGTTFTFWVDSVRFGANDTLAGSDVAPDGTAVYPYTLTAPPPPPAPLTLSAGAPSFSPKARAGALETIRIPITRSDTHGGLASGTAACAVKIGTVRAAGVVGSVHSGAALCKLRIPQSAHGKTLRGTVTVHFKNAAVTKSFSTHIA
jgi:hypothetical protein